MNKNHKIGLFKVHNVENFEGTVNFDIKTKVFLTYDKAYEYVLEAFKRNGKCMPWDSRYLFYYDRMDDGLISVHNLVEIEMVLPFYLHIGREWL